MVGPIRILVGVLGALMIVGGLAAVASGDVPDGLWVMVIGAVAIVAVALERSRYRSEAAERTAGDPGPGGGEPSTPAPPFIPTEERFVDPTTGRRLRVYVDPATGERRYFAEEQSLGG
jgi:hypothetical protein